MPPQPAYDRHGYFAGRDADRLQALESADAVVRLSDDAHATARSYYLFFGDTTTTPSLRTMGQYDDVFVRGERGWQLAHRTITLG